MNERSSLDLSSLKPNSEASKRQEAEEEAKVIAVGRLVHPEKSIGEKIFTSLFDSTFEESWKYVVQNVIKPNAKKLVFGSIVGYLGKLFFNDGNIGSSTSSGTNVFYKSSLDTPGWAVYNGASKQQKTQNEPKKEESGKLDGVIIYETKSTAQEVLDHLIAECNQYDKVTVYEYYVSSKVPANYTMHDYGWLDIPDNVRPVEANGGWILQLPPPVNLKIAMGGK